MRHFCQSRATDLVHYKWLTIEQDLDESLDVTNPESGAVLLECWLGLLAIQTTVSAGTTTWTIWGRSAKAETTMVRSVGLD